MEEQVQLGSIYKTKKGKTLCCEEILSPYVIVQNYINNPLEKKIFGVLSFSTFLKIH